MVDKCALVVEDSPSNIAVLSALIEREGLRCTVIQIPDDLSKLVYHTQTVDVVFLDLELPRHNGYEILAELRTHIPKVPIIACTVHTSEISRAREAGFDGFLGKPLHAKRFPAQLRAILQGEQVWEI